MTILSLFLINKAITGVTLLGKIKFLEFGRMGLCAMFFYFAYSAKVEGDMQGLAFWLVLATCGALSLLTAIETYLGKGKSNDNLGWEDSPYRYQSANNNMATALVGLGSLAMGLSPESLGAISAVSVLFFTFNGVNHAMSGLNKNLTIKQKTFNLTQRSGPALLLFFASLPLLENLLLK